jgi:hypothetical protein
VTREEEEKPMLLLDVSLKAALRDDTAARSYLCDLHQQILNTRNTTLLETLLGKYVAVAASRGVPLRSATEMFGENLFQTVTPATPPTTSGTPQKETFVQGFIPGASSLSIGPKIPGGSSISGGGFSTGPQLVVTNTLKIAGSIVGGGL